MTKTARVPAALVRGLEGIGDAPPGPAGALVRRPEDDLFRESVLVAVAAAHTSDAFGPGEVAREVVEEAVRAACTVRSSEEWSFVVVDSPAARRRLLLAGTGGDDLLRAAPTLIVPCIRVAGRRASAPRTEASTLLSAGAAIRTLVVALHAQLVGWSWDPDRPFDPDAARAALALDEEWRPLGIVAVGPKTQGGASRPRPPTPSMDRRD